MSRRIALAALLSVLAATLTSVALAASPGPAAPARSPAIGVVVGAVLAARRWS